MNNANIGWYARGSHLHYMPRLSDSLKTSGLNIKSFYVCHTEDEELVLESEYCCKPHVLGRHLDGVKYDRKFCIDKLKYFEKVYGSIPLSRILWSERFERNESDDVLLDHFVSHFQFWEKFLIDNQIDYVVSELPSILSTSVLWVLCKKLNVGFISLGNWGIDGRLVFNSSWGCGIDGFEVFMREGKVDKNSENYQSAVNVLEKMNNAPEKPKWLSYDVVTGKRLKEKESFGSPLIFPKLPSLGKLATMPSKIRAKKRTYYLNSQSILKSYQIAFMAVIRNWTHRIYGILDKGVDYTEEPYFVFPLHILKEVGDYSWMGLKYPNMLNVVEECAACLPFGHKLYVKEHPSCFPEKSFSFYRSLKRIPNVRLIAHDEDNFDVARHSKGIITLGSTMGWEAFLSGIKVFVLVDIWYEILPGIYRAKGPEELAELLQNNSDLRSATREEKIKAIYGLYESSFEGVFYPTALLNSKDNIQKMTVAFTRYMETFSLNRQEYSRSDHE